jgi:kynurenine formamidase
MSSSSGGASARLGAAVLARSGSGGLVDCTHTLTPSTLSFASHFNLIGGAQAPVAEASTPGFSIGAAVDTRTAAGTGFRKCMYHMPCDVGTHIDSPAHWYPGGRDVSELTLDELTAPGAVIDVSRQVEASLAAAAVAAAAAAAADGAGGADDAVGGDGGGDGASYGLSVGDVLQFEAEHGRIPPRALVVMKTGWAGRFGDHGAYVNGGAFPGFSGEAARWLIDERDVAGIGVDTASLDVSPSAAYPVHCAILGSDRYQIENMKLEGVPAGLGSVFISLPLKVAGGPEAETRVMCILPA